ncbi:ferric reductase-like transmembrane domain-containing protein [Candidatus Woesebacteria bacterium]|nr:ferric reductase-like transmembrane domain-containing protein [Candidatus Woesebacteria bacterium]
MQKLRALVLSIQVFLAPKRALITKLFFAMELLLVTFFILILCTAGQVYDAYFTEIYFVGSKLGIVALGLFCLTLLPGIITRLQWFPLVTQPIASILLPHRRHLGILMFLTAWVHMALSTTLPQLTSNGFDLSKIQLSTFEIFGQLAWWLLLPLWLSSNDFSQKKLGKNWKKLHMLTYAALFLIFFHVALQNSGFVFLLGSVGILELISWIAVWKRTQTPPVVLARPQPMAAEISVPRSSNPPV